jgi:hypothetical protein
VAETKLVLASDAWLKQNCLVLASDSWLKQNCLVLASGVWLCGCNTQRDVLVAS